jgi:signal transduction histidine kinase
VLAYDGLITDITSLKQAEELAELKQKQLIQADKMASLGILVSGIAHEINNPNNFIILNIQLFKQIWDDIRPILKEYYHDNGDFVIGGMPYSSSITKINQSLEGVRTGADRIRTIVDSLRNYARHDTDSLENTVEIKEVLDNAITIIENLLIKSTRNFQLLMPAGLPRIKGNSQQLEQVVINLLTNACQSLPDRGKSIIVRVFTEDESHLMCIRIQDEGIGIPEEHLKHIFDPFFTTKRDAGGTGLGLSITYNIIKSHGGELELISDPGKGTTALITLPIAKEQEVEE